MAKNYGRVKAYDVAIARNGDNVQWRYIEGPNQAFVTLFTLSELGGLTESQVDEKISIAISSLPPSGLTETQVKVLIAEAINAIPPGTGDGLTEGEVLNLINAALADLDEVDPADLISDEAGNSLELCAQGKLFVSAGGRSYEHTQAVPAAQWSIQHNLQSLLVSAVTVDSDGNEVIGFVDRANSTQNLLFVQFSQPIAGLAYIRL